VEKVAEKYDVIVIGAGVGGLACGAYLSKHGVRTLVIDKNSFSGGYCSVFRRGDFTFHAGPEGILGLGKEGFLTYRLRELGLEKNVEFNRIEPLDRTYFCGMEIVASMNIEEYIESLQSHFPEDGDAIPKYFDAMTRMAREVTSPDFKIPKGFLSMIKFARRYPTTTKYGRKMFKDILDAFFKDQRLKFLLASYPTNWLGVPPSELMAPWAAVCTLGYTEGLYYPKGGIQKFTDCIAETLTQNGGELVLGKVVSKILIDNGVAVGVQLEDGSVARGTSIVSNVDAKQTFLNLVGEQHLEKEFTDYIRQLKQSVSGFVVYLGVDANLKNYDPYIRYLGGEKESDWDKYHRSLRNGQLDMNGMAITIPSNLEPSYAPAGKSSVILLGFAPYGYKNNWMTKSDGTRTKQYQSLKKEVANQMITLAEKVIPDLSENIIVKDAATPLTFQRYTWNTEGAWYGPRLDAIRMPPYVTPVKHLYLAGSSTSGAGVPSAFMSGITTAKEILELKRV
jgi:all-trans-retinol 13,14-reductase